MKMRTIKSGSIPKKKIKEVVRSCSIQAAKAKGRKGQQEVVKLLLHASPGLREDDIRSTPMGSQGEDVLLSPRARQRFPWNIEVKRGKAFNLVQACKQAEFRNKPIICPNINCLTNETFGPVCQACEGKKYIIYQPVAIGRYDRDKKWYATIELDYLLELII